MSKFTKGFKGWSRFVASVLGSPIEIVRRVFRKPWVSSERVMWIDDETGRSITSGIGSEHDKFSWAPNLMGSIASLIHDAGWVSGRWDDGIQISFNDINRVFRDILEHEEHPPAVIRMYYWGVSRNLMRKKWEKKHDHS